MKEQRACQLRADGTTHARLAGAAGWADGTALARLAGGARLAPDRPRRKRESKSVARGGTIRPGLGMRKK